MLVRRAGLTAVRWLYIIRKVGSDKRGGNGFLQGCKTVVRGGERKEGRVGSKKVHAKRQKKGERGGGFSGQPTPWPGPPLI